MSRSPQNFPQDGGNIGLVAKEKCLRRNPSDQQRHVKPMKLSYLNASKNEWALVYAL
jgi:hypothetical protein